MSGKCGSGGDSSMKKDKGPCPRAGSEKKDKGPCPRAGAEKKDKGPCQRAAFEKKDKGPCQSAASEKKSGCSKSPPTTMANNSESTGSRCGCGSDSNTKKDKCGESEKKSGFSKTPCKTPQGGKGKCHESHEQFKKKSETEGCKSGGDSPVAKCSSSYREFAREVRGDSPCGGSSESECHDSYKKFQENKPDDCSDEEVPKRESRLQSSPCSAQKKHEICSGSSDNTNSHTTLHDTKIGCQSQTKKEPCSNSEDFISEKKKSPCSSKLPKQGEAPMYAKITSRCKDMVKDFVKPKTKSKCSGGDESSQKNSMCHKTVPPSLPCPPTTETGVGYTQPCCTSKVTCAEPKAPSWADFFPLDARNQKLNACIDKYSKIDPGQVISQCSQFANKPLDTSERCKQQTQQTQQRCVATQRVGMPDPPRKSVMLISPHARMLVSRWAPSAALYLSTAALATLFLTEWKAVPIYVSDSDEADKDGKS